MLRWVKNWTCCSCTGQPRTHCDPLGSLLTAVFPIAKGTQDGLHFNRLFTRSYGWRAVNVPEPGSGTFTVNLDHFAPSIWATLHHVTVGNKFDVLSLYQPAQDPFGPFGITLKAVFPVAKRSQDGPHFNIFFTQSY